MGTEQTGPLHNNIWYCLIVLDGELCKITDSKKLILRGILTLVTLHSEAVVGTASLQEGIKVSSDSFARVSRRKKNSFSTLSQFQNCLAKSFSPFQYLFIKCCFEFRAAD